ncbi:MAG: hypothetical protein M1823_005623 [Watsoniomyces obsoletus]|nr:MAG: hypothetical protein M1823_005623 [Watsoniomyces obsoletus]
MDEPTLPMFNVEKVELQFSIASDFVAAQVANNVLVLALSTGRVLRIDLGNPGDIDDIDLPRRSSEIGVIRRMFLDPTASHLLISTTLGENIYLHSQSRQPRLLSRLKGVSIESVAWNPSRPTASTREILVGALDGSIYEVFIEPSTEFYRRDERYLKIVYKIPDGPVTGLWVGLGPGRPDHRMILVASHGRLLLFTGQSGRSGQDGTSPTFARLFESESPAIHELSRISGSAPSSLVLSPDETDHPSLDPTTSSERAFAWLSSQGVFHGSLRPSRGDADLGQLILAESRFCPRSQIPSSEASRSPRKPGPQSVEPIAAIALTHWHILNLVEGRVVAVNRLDDSIAHDQLVLGSGQSVVSFISDRRKSTFWLVTAQEILEIVVNNEDRDIWRIMLKRGDFDAAMRYARTAAQKDAVAVAYGDHLIEKSRYLDAAGVYGKSSKAFEQVAMAFIDHREQDALRRYLLTKLNTLKKSLRMQRTMVASWLVELFMSKLDGLDDTITTDAELSEDSNIAQSREELSQIQAEFQEFVVRYKADLDQRTTYDIISSHGREAELLYYATLVQDYDYVLTYWVQREQWTSSLAVLKKQTEPQLFYKYSSVQMLHTPNELVDILMRQANIEPRSLIPALLNYSQECNAPLNQNQAVRYLLYVINKLQSTDSAVHNTLISIYASHPSRDESALLGYLELQSRQEERNYDADFALRLCIQHNRVQSCVHIYSVMGQYLQAVELALKHDEIDLASIVADRPDDEPALRKTLWLAVAKKVIAQTNGVKSAIQLLKRCELLRIEDLIPFFPDFVVIDDFKEEVCAALEDYSRHIDLLKKEMDESSQTAANIKSNIASLSQRCAIVEPGERCYLCQYPLLSRQFFVFPCQHAFHSDCLAKLVAEHAGMGKARRIRDLQTEVGRGVAVGSQRERAIKELDSLIAASCVLCSEFAVKRIDEPFVTPMDSRDEWALS